MRRTDEKANPLALISGIILGIVVAALTDISGIRNLHAQETQTIRLLSAGSLRAAMTEITDAFTAGYGVKVETVFGSAGLLRERIEKGENADLFASANMENPLKLMQAEKSGPVVRFARNSLCAVARPGLGVTPDRLLATMLDPAIKLGTSTPVADPSGDYTWEAFRKAEAIEPGSRAKLEAKALQLIGGANSTRPPAGANVVAWHLREGRADLFIAYCSGAPAAVAQLPGATVVTLPPQLATGADYGLTVLNDGNAAPAGKLALFILSPAGQKILAGHGFDVPLN